MLLSTAIDNYVTDRVERAEIVDYTAQAIRWRLMVVRRCIGDTDVRALTPAHTRAYEAAIGWQRPASRKAHISTWRRFCRWLLEEDLIAQDPALRAGRVREPRHVPRALNPAQLSRLWASLPDARARLIVALMARLGLRCCEVANLRVEDFDSQATTLLIRGKFDNQRRLPVPPDVAELLGDHVAGRLAGAMFGTTGARLVSRQVVKWMKRAGIKAAARDGVSAHALRHTAAADLYGLTKDLRLVKGLLGHSNVATTDRYIGDSDLDTMRRALAGRGAVPAGGGEAHGRQRTSPGVKERYAAWSAVVTHGTGRGIPGPAA